LDEEFNRDCRHLMNNAADEIRSNTSGPFKYSGVGFQSTREACAQRVAAPAAEITHRGEPHARPALWIGPLLHGNDWIGQSWETLCWIVLWFCGLAALSLCFR
jgi:hypothetical protein